MSLSTDINCLRDWLLEAHLNGIKAGDVEAIAANLKDIARRADALELASVPDSVRYPIATNDAALRLVHSGNGGAA